jgi:hypothetical protein
MKEYAVKVTHLWTVIIEAENGQEAHRLALEEDGDLQRKYRDITAEVIGEVG